MSGELSKRINKRMIDASLAKVDDIIEEMWSECPHFLDVQSEIMNNYPNLKNPTAIYILACEAYELKNIMWKRKWGG